MPGSTVEPRFGSFAEGCLWFLPAFPGTYLISLDYPLDPLSCAYTCETYFDPDLDPSFGEPLIGSFLLHIDDSTKLLVTVAPGGEGPDPIDTPIHFACWNTQANRGSLSR